MMNTFGLLDLKRMLQMKIPDHVNIMFDDKFLSEIRMRHAAVGTMEDGSGPVIVVGKNFMRLPLSYKQVCVAHELGHVVCGHLEGMDEARAIEISKERKEAVLRGEVVIYEREADDYAVSLNGVKRVISFLEYLKRTRPHGPVGSNTMIGHLELEYRIRRLQRTPYASN